MMPKPFKFFFGLSLGIMLFFFLARFAIAAFFIAAVLSVLYFIARKVFNFLKYLTWRENHKIWRETERHSSLPIWKDDMLVEYPKLPSYKKNRRIIEII